MGYLPVGITETDARSAMLDLRRREVELEERRYADSKKSRVWENLIRAAGVAIPVLTFFGFQQYFAAQRKKKR